MSEATFKDEINSFKMGGVCVVGCVWMYVSEAGTRARGQAEGHQLPWDTIHFTFPSEPFIRAPCTTAKSFLEL